MNQFFQGFKDTREIIGGVNLPHFLGYMTCCLLVVVGGVAALYGLVGLILWVFK